MSELMVVTLPGGAYTIGLSETMNPFPVIQMAGINLWKLDAENHIFPMGGEIIPKEYLDLDGKVDKVEGYTLSKNDFTNLDLLYLENSKIRVFQFFMEGELEVLEKAQGYPIPFNMEIVGILLGVFVAPSGADLILDIGTGALGSLDNTSLYSTQDNRPTIINGELSGTVILPDTILLNGGDALYLDIDQIGSTTPGEGLMVSVLAKVLIEEEEV